MYILTRSLDGMRIVGDFICKEDLAKYPVCAYYDWNAKQVIFRGKFTQKEKKEILLRLEM